MQKSSNSSSMITQWLRGTSSANFAAYSIVAAFSTYFCMYAFRKPFTAGEFSDVMLWGIGYKIILVAAQVSGYTCSKFIGIKVISEMPPQRRAFSILVLIGFAELALLIFAIVPPPWNFVMLFLNGLPLGMVFGLVLSFLEGRRLTETLSAGLCASFILASGFVKYVGASLLDLNVSEYWMPFYTGLIFVVPLVLGVFMLSQIPQPSDSDRVERSERTPMSRADRVALFRRHAWGLSGLVLVFILLTVMRSIRDDFAVEIWSDLGHEDAPEVFAQSELAVMLGVIAINGAAAWIRTNRTALLGSLLLTLAGFLLVLGSLWGQQTGLLNAFSFMVLIGLGTYVPYVAFHTTIFERFLAAFRERGNIGYLMYLADATGYLAYVGVMIGKNFLPSDINYLRLFLNTTLSVSIAALGIVALLLVHYYRTTPRGIPSERPSAVASELA